MQFAVLSRYVQCGVVDQILSGGLLVQIGLDCVRLIVHEGGNRWHLDLWNVLAGITDSKTLVSRIKHECTDFVFWAIEKRVSLDEFRSSIRT